MTKDQVIKEMRQAIDQQFPQGSYVPASRLNLTNLPNEMLSGYMESHPYWVPDILENITASDGVFKEFKRVCRNGREYQRDVLSTTRIPETEWPNVWGEMAAWHWALQWLKRKEKEIDNER